MKENFLNLLISLDCCVGICMAHLIFLKSTEVLLPRSSPAICSLVEIGAFFLAMLNGLLPVGIVIYRLIRVCCPSWVMTTEQRRSLNYFILVLTLGSSIGLTASAFYYREHYEKYQMCLGDSFEGPVWDLPSLHPFPLATKASLFSRAIFVPIGYVLIYFFRRKTDKKAPGLSENSRIKRMTRNVVNAKFNFYVWLSEMSCFIVLIFRDTFSLRLYMVLSFGLTPILYLLGMEETRTELQKIQKHIF